MISYEISIGLIIMCVLLTRNTFNLSILVETQKSIWFIIPLFPLFIMFYISIIAETNRAPFDLPEAINLVIILLNAENYIIYNQQKFQRL